ncbi:MAG: glycerol-3-phosphate 1-O-acyltransferase PlsY [Vampirovibrio sp.]
MLTTLHTELVEWPFYILWGGALVVAYLMGSLPTGYLIAKLFYNIDITQEGSGNTGGTNVMRLCGKTAGFSVYGLDFLKAFLPVFLLRQLLPADSWLHLAVGVCAIIGHSKSIFLKFKGGKSAMSSLGVIAALSPLGSLFLGGLAVTLILSTRMVSVGSMITGICAAPLLFFLGSPLPYVGFCFLAAILVLLRHRDNIKRIMAGTERKI